MLLPLCMRGSIHAVFLPLSELSPTFLRMIFDDGCKLVNDCARGPAIAGLEQQVDGTIAPGVNLQARHQVGAQLSYGS
jgi:hypothetical protein